MKKKNMNQDLAYDEFNFEEMPEYEMKEWLIELHNTIYWLAIKRYNLLRRGVIDNSLHTIDPVKEPTQIARNQGIGQGLIDLETYIEEEIDRRKTAAAKKNSGETPSQQASGLSSGY